MKNINLKKKTFATIFKPKNKENKTVEIVLKAGTVYPDITTTPPGPPRPPIQPGQPNQYNKYMPTVNIKRPVESITSSSIGNIDKSETPQKNTDLSLHVFETPDSNNSKVSINSQKEDAK